MREVAIRIGLVGRDALFMQASETGFAGIVEHALDADGGRNVRVVHTIAHATDFHFPFRAIDASLLGAGVVGEVVVEP